MCYNQRNSFRFDVILLKQNIKLMSLGNTCLGEVNEPITDLRVFGTQSGF